MSYDIYMRDPETGSTCVLPENHNHSGGTFILGGTGEAWLNVTYNYAPFYYKALDAEKGIRWLYGKTGAEALPRLEAAIATLGTGVSDDYWEPTPGNAGNALLGLAHFARACPAGVFEGD